MEIFNELTFYVNLTETFIVASIKLYYLISILLSYERSSHLVNYKQDTKRATHIK